MQRWRTKFIFRVSAHTLAAAAALFFSFIFMYFFSLLGTSCSCGTQNAQMAISLWCTAQACGSSTGATPSSPSSTRTTPCCWCLESTLAPTTHLQGKSLSSVWVGETNSKSNRWFLFLIKFCFSVCAFNLSSLENYTLLSRVRNKPYDVFGCWLNETHLISGNLHWIGNMTSCSVLWLNKAFQVCVCVC